MIGRLARKSWETFASRTMKSDFYFSALFFTREKLIRSYLRRVQHSVRRKLLQVVLSPKKLHAVPLTSLASVGFIRAETSKEETNEEKLYELQEKLASKFISTEELKGAIEMLAEMSSKEGKDFQDGDSEWNLVMDKENIKVWRKCRPNSSICHYRCYGKVPDVAACAFFKVQFEDQLKKSADKAIKVLDTSPVDLNMANQSLDKGETETETKSAQIPPMKGLDRVHWVHAFPFPLKARSYRYFRRATYDEEKNAFVVISKADPKEASSETGKNDYVEITEYYSCMAIRPLEGKSVGDLGLEYVLSYTDDQQIVLPRRFVTAATSDGIPRAIDQICCAAKVLFASNKQACLDAKQEFSSDRSIRNGFATKQNSHYQPHSKSKDEGGNNPKTNFFSKSKSRDSKEPENAKVQEACSQSNTINETASNRMTDSDETCESTATNINIGNSYQEKLKFRLTALYKYCYNYMNKESLIYDEARDDLFHLL